LRTTIGTLGTSHQTSTKMNNHDASPVFNEVGRPVDPVANSIEKSPFPMAIVFGANHTLRVVNPAFALLLDCGNGAFVGKPIGDCVANRVKFLKRLDRVYQTGQSGTFTEQQPASDEATLWSYTMWPADCSVPPSEIMILITDAAELQKRSQTMNEALVVSAVRQHELREAADLAVSRLQVEIGERQQAETALRSAKAELAEHGVTLERVVAERTAELYATNQHLEAFVYSIAHDLRAPLRAMQSYSALLVDEAGDTWNDTAKHYTERIKKSGSAMDAMLTDLLAFSRLSQQDVQLKPVRLEGIITKMIAELASGSVPAAVPISVSGPWPVVLAHHATLLQVLVNLTSNALKFVVTGREPSIQVRAQDLGDYVRVWVEDNGPGIPADCQSEIFGIFTRLNGEKYPGTGIGLAIVQKGIERMGGRVGVESTVGEGSRFWFELKTVAV